MKRIIQILDQVKQGTKNATFCRAEDDRIYVTKIRKNDSNSLISEWIAGRIGLALGLPIPPIEQLSLELAQAKYIIHPDALAMAEAPCFGSRFVEPADEFSPAQTKLVGDQLKCRILFFDWWVHNQDRSDGNTNLLWLDQQKVLRVIDHNLAFDKNFNQTAFWNDHIFRESSQLWDSTFKAQISEEIRSIIKCLPDYWDELPVEWTDRGGAISRDAIEDILQKANQPSFWNIP